MANILRANVQIAGIRAMLWHHFGPDALPLEKQEKTGVAGRDPEEWKKTVLMTSDRKLYVKSSYLFAAIRDGAKHTPRKRGTLQPFISATLQVEEDLIFIERDGEVLRVPEMPEQNPELSVFLDVQGVRNPSTRARNLRYRIGASSGWTASFHIQWDKTIVSRGEMEAAVIDAGRFTGIADGRSVGYGRFELMSFDVAELQSKKAA